MARLESIAVGGYYPTPPKVIPLIASMLDAPGNGGAFFDPCAGDGAAILALRREIRADKASVNAIEMEKSRFETLQAAVRQACGYSRETLHGDAFRVSFDGTGCTLLYLNPPYDLDPEHCRLEEKFLSRFTAALMPGGVLVYVVPFYALKASAATLATHYDADVRCYRFPEDEFAAYKQVVLFAAKRSAPLWAPDPAIIATVEAWASNADGIPALKDGGARYTLPAITDSWYRPFSEDWKVRPLDLKALLAKTAPWSMTDRGGRSGPVPGIVPEGALDDLLVRRYPLAMPPRPAHIAAGIAAGIFNGAKIGPDAGGTAGELLVKGVFDKEFRTVDEKKDKEGNVKAVVQVQQPRLVTTVLDLAASKYVTIKASSEVTGTRNVADMTMADLLATYGRGLMDVMLAQCPVLHEPSREADAIPLPTLARPLFHAQRHAVMAAVKLLGGLGSVRRRHKAAFVLGEIGSGKTSVALATAMAIGTKRTLVMCPPHLLTSWQDQIKAVTPHVRVVVLNDVTDVQALAADKATTTPVIAILSRETAKLGHAYAAVTRCGACGTIPEADVDHAKKRSTCTGTRLIAKGALGRLLRDFLVDLVHVFPGDLRVRQLVRRGSPVDLAATRWAAREGVDAWEAHVLGRDTFGRLIDHLLDRAEDVSMLEALELFLLADPIPELLLHVARALYAKRPTEKTWSTPETIATARRLLLFVPDVDIAEFTALDDADWARYGTAWTDDFQKQRAVLAGDDDPTGNFGAYWSPFGITRRDGKVMRGHHVVGDKRTALDAFVRLANIGLRWSSECGAPLYQAIPEPRRYPVATYIAKHYPHTFDLLVLDEGHEYATDGSAQERSAHRLTSLGIPTLLLTGTVMNGYAESMFTNMWALSSDFRREFAREDRQRFIDRYGYRKRLVEDRDKSTGKVVEYGAVSDRVERSERMIGDAPGVLPVFLLKYLLPMSVTLHKTDLSIDIPRCIETVRSVTPGDVQGENFRTLQSALMQQISADRFKEGLAGKLWGALAELPGYLDCATDDVGNTDDGRYEIRYPENAGGGVVATVDPLPAATLLPKEAWLIKHLDAAFADGRNVLIFAWHTRLLARIARLVKKHTGEECTILVPSKVPTAKRETWINQEVVGRKRRVMVCNPVTVQTGLNNLVYFSDEVWLENPACNPVIYRQAVGRVDRIGQTRPTNIVFPLYEGTLQTALHRLLMQKVGVSMSTDGLDGESAMAAAGIGDDGGFSAFSVGRQLYELIQSGKAAA